MLRHTAELKQPLEKIRRAREVAKFLFEASAAGTTSQQKALHDELALIETLPDWYLFHDFLEEENEAFYFTDFAGRALQSGLQYVTEADPSMMLPEDLSPVLRKRLGELTSNMAEREQFIDFARNAVFRRAVLRRGTAQLEHRIDFDEIEHFRIQAHCREDQSANGVATFRGRSGAVLHCSDTALKAATRTLCERFPERVPFDVLLKSFETKSADTRSLHDLRARLSRHLLQCFLGGFVSLHLLPSRAALKVSERPCASALARIHAERGNTASNLSHEPIELGEHERALLPLLDGTRSQPELASALKDRGIKLTPFEIGACLARLADNSFLES